MAAGKTTFARYLSETLNACVIDLDDLAKQAYNEPEVKRFVRREIEPMAFNPEGVLVKNALFRAIFSDSQKRKKLEKFIYPLLKEKVRKMILKNAEETPFIIIEGVKLKEASIYEIADLRIVVLTSRDSQWQRLKSKGLPTYRIQHLLNAQKKMSEYISEADLIVNNDSDLKKLKDKALEISRAI